ncbi:MAG: aminopeptidase P N-terminal domain-containing protein [Verrucomicrobiae bacterium]|nr:aminopeptidase P N-terminal domain-containing protein [Verrucomicrobiae bacterium]
MRHAPIKPSLFKRNRDRLRRLLHANSLVILNANDVLPANADGTLVMVPNSDLFHLSGVEQEESILVLAPDAVDESQREILFLREPNPHLLTWEGHKLDRDEATRLSGIKEIRWLGEFPTVLHQLMCEVEHVYLNSNEHRRAVVEVETRDARFVRECQRRYPLHRYHRLARLMHALRVVKSPEEVELIKRASRITRQGFLRAAKFVQPGVNEMEIEAEFAHAFIREGAKFAYPPIIAAGGNSCVLHYLRNDAVCRKGDVVLLDVAASYGNYNSDLTRTLPVSGKFSRRQMQVYRSVLRVMRAMIQACVPGKLHREWQKEAEAMIQEELLKLGLLKPRDIRNQDPKNPALKRYFMHGLGHVLGLDVHDVGFMSEPFAPGWVLTVEPGIYIPEEGFGVRLENDVLVTEKGPVDLMADIPVEPEEVEALMNGAGGRKARPR